jgi:hypothetical protein
MEHQGQLLVDILPEEQAEPVGMNQTVEEVVLEEAEEGEMAEATEDHLLHL